MSQRDEELRARLLQDAMEGRITRRQVLKRAGALGLSASFLSVVLAACADDDDFDDLEELVQDTDDDEVDATEPDDDADAVDDDDPDDDDE